MITEEEINHQSVGPWGFFDCEDRSLDAQDTLPQYFNDPEHIAKIDQVKNIVESFFKVKRAVYVNHRLGTTKSGPFSVVKVDQPVFPNTLKQSEKDALFYAPLEALGVTIRYNKGSGSYLFRIR